MTRTGVRAADAFRHIGSLREPIHRHIRRCLQPGTQNVACFGDEIILFLRQQALPSVSLASTKLTETPGNWCLEIDTPNDRKSAANPGSIDCP